MKKFLLLLILCPVLCFSQEKEYTGTNIKYCPTALSIFPFQAIQFSIEHDISHRFSLQAEFGYGIGLRTLPRAYTKLTDTQFVKPVGWKFNTELRYYFHKKKTEHYIAFNVFYRYHLTNSTLEYQTPTDSFNTRFDSWVARKNTYGAAVVWGLQKRWGWLVMNPYFGMGVSYRTVVTSGLEYDPAKGDEFPHDLHWDLGDGFIESSLPAHAEPQFYMTIGFRVGYAFMKRYQ